MPDGTTQRFDAPGPNLPTGWSTSGNASWTVVDDPAHAYGTGRYVARAGTILNSQSSNLRSPTITVGANGGVLSYSVWNSSEYGKDGLHFYVSYNGGAFVEQDQFQNPNDPYPYTFFSGVPNLTTAVQYPASLSSTIAVGASSDWDYRSMYSQYGTTLDFVAPSNGGYGAVYTTDRTGTNGYNQQSTNSGQPGYDPLTDHDYTSLFGRTSAATPLAAGIAALMLSKNPDLTATEVRTIMRSTADKIGGNNGATAYVSNGQGTFNQFYGYGRVNAVAALAATPWPGDYNNNTVVDAADYSVWRNYLGQPVSIPNDITPGTVTQPDYDVWRGNFGKTSTDSTGSAAFVPGDYDQSGTVDEADYAVWQADYGSTTNLEADGDFNGVVDMGDLVVWEEMRNVTTEEIIPGDFNSDGIVDMSDKALWDAQDPLADANGDSVVDGDDLAIWSDHWGLTNAGVNPATLVGSPPLRVVNQAPHVTGVRLSGSTSTHDPYDFDGVVGSGEQLRTVPVGGLDTIELSFNEEVYVTADDLTLNGLNNNNVPDLLNFSYDLNSQTATWQFANSLPYDQYLVRLSDSVYDLDHDALDGEFTNPWSLAESSGYASTFPSGDGTAGGEFRFRFTNLPGDFSHSNNVDTSDYVVWSSHNGTMSGAPHAWGDADGDGDVDNGDYAYWSSEYNTDYARWPSIEPGMILVSNAADESDANYSYGDLSLREALSIAANQSGPDTIVFDPSITDIGLTLGYLTIDSDLTVEGPGADLLTIDGQGNSTVFFVNSGANATIRGVTITGGYSGYGAGIYNVGNLTVDQTDIEGNHATALGGGIYTSLLTDPSSLTVTNSTIYDNSATYYGGGIFITNSTALIANSTISTNTAGNGGGIYDGSHTAQVVNCTVTLNTATSGSGGGIYGSASGGDATKVLNSIVAGNSAATSATDDIAGSFNSTSDYNLIGYDPNEIFPTGSGSIIGVSSAIDARLAPLDYYGGLTKTHALYYDSLAIDAGDDASAVAFDLYDDQRGNDRIDDGDGDMVAHVDIGAFELAADEYFSEV